MATLEHLPADQRAVLQLVLQRGRGYDEIARLLSMDRAAVRARALDAFDALGPQTGVGDQRRALITDYLLGQLPPAVNEQVRDHLAQSPSERAWARVLASELAPLANHALPEIPTESTRIEAPVAAPAGAEPATASAPEKKKRESVLLRRRRRQQAAKEAGAGGGGSRLAADIAAATGAARSPEPEPGSAAADGERRSSRIGGAILIAVGVLVAVGVVVFIISRSGSTPPHTAAAASGSSSTAPAVAATTTSGATSSGARLIAQVNLKPTAKDSKATGIAEVLKEGSSDGIAIVAQNVPPNSSKPPNAYAVWLYNAPTDAHFLGFVNPGVGTNGKLSTAGGLPTNASRYKQLVVTVETIAHPKAPGTIILAGPLSGL
ncbi:MAG: hypothetical protein QOF83_706 [Solirubrobacteraceae bacterium]|jgi:hypothetical protein|nr:hypothetical protein [Solirubrobacteraceae bacterium]